MSSISLPVLAGTASSVIFAGSALPMLIKAYRSRDLKSYSFGNIALSNVGNAVHSVYVFSLPPGPIWALHTFYLVSTALMLGWYVRYGRRRIPHRRLEGWAHRPYRVGVTARPGSPGAGGWGSG
jgi:hypothetical protein